MPQFDIHARPGRHPDDPLHYLLNLQADLLDDLQTRLVAPLARLDAVKAPVRTLNPRIDIHGQSFLLLTHLSAAVPLRTLGATIGNAKGQRAEIIMALDLLITGI
jgi:toxin CcdB